MYSTNNSTSTGFFQYDEKQLNEYFQKEVRCIYVYMYYRQLYMYVTHSQRRAHQLRFVYGQRKAAEQPCHKALFGFLLLETETCRTMAGHLHSQHSAEEGGGQPRQTADHDANKSSEFILLQNQSVQVDNTK